MPANEKSADRVGIIAGAGPLPFIVAEGAAARGLEVAVAGLEGIASPELPSRCEVFTSIEPGELGACIEFFRISSVREVLLCGQIDHSQVFAVKRPDELMRSVLAEADKRAEKLLGRIADAIEEHGLPVGDIRGYLGSHLAGEGTLGQVEPSNEILRDLEFAWPLALRFVELNIGQALVVRGGVVLAAEALEGTDGMIRRAAELPGGAGRRATVIKLPLKNKDPRFDLPVIGIDTVRAMADVGASLLVVAAGQTIIVDRPDVFTEAADSAGIAVFGRCLPGDN